MLNWCPTSRKPYGLCCCTSVQADRPGNPVRDQAGATGNNPDWACSINRTEKSNFEVFPNLEEHKRGRDILLAFNQDVGASVRMTCEQDADSDVIHLARAANIARRDMLKMTTAFSGSFDTLCQEESVPNALIALVSMILNGPNIHEQSSHSSIPAPTLTISQLLQFNSCARRRKSTGSVQSTKHSHNRETPVPVYLRVMIHTKTRR